MGPSIIFHVPDIKDHIFSHVLFVHNMLKLFFRIFERMRLAFWICTFYVATNGDSHLAFNAQASNLMPAVLQRCFVLHLFIWNEIQHRCEPLLCEFSPPRSFFSTTITLLHSIGASSTTTMMTATSTTHTRPTLRPIHGGMCYVRILALVSLCTEDWK